MYFVKGIKKTISVIKENDNNGKFSRVYFDKANLTMWANTYEGRFDRTAYDNPCIVQVHIPLLENVCLTDRVKAGVALALQSGKIEWE